LGNLLFLRRLEIPVLKPVLEFLLKRIIKTHHGSGPKLTCKRLLFGDILPDVFLSKNWDLSPTKLNYKRTNKKVKKIIFL
jgi:hypothetical protein